MPFSSANLFANGDAIIRPSFAVLLDSVVFPLSEETDFDSSFFGSWEGFLSAFTAASFLSAAFPFFFT